MSTQDSRTIGFLIYDGLQALDLFGPQEAFAAANNYLNPRQRRYNTLLISKDGESVRSESGVRIDADCSFRDCPTLDTLIVPGGRGARTDVDWSIVEWLEFKARRVRRLGSVCTGLFILARTNLLHRRKVTTHWQFVEEAMQRFPDLMFDPDALFLRDGKIFTAAGVTAGIDMALALMEEDLGAQVASQVARELVVFLRRPGGQNQFSNLLQQQIKGSNQFSELISWITDHLDEDLSSQAMAERCNLSERHFRRKFKAVYGEPPSQMVESIRIETAKALLSQGYANIDRIAKQVGFNSADTFRRSFERLTSITPSEYRSRFSQGLNKMDNKTLDERPPTPQLRNISYGRSSGDLVVED